MSKHKKQDSEELTPLSRVEILYKELVNHYGDADDKDKRAAAKLLLVALDRFSNGQNPQWEKLVNEYVSLAKHDPAKFANILRSNRGEASSHY